ncbi:hypothetical protein L0Y65_06930 [Candidatus Micrarchaeota archaeon]|nr:hypothetical protein [Candidatus Micrarchaeota archaeon]
MSEDDILVMGCAGILILAAIGVIAFVIMGMKAYSFEKRKEGANTCLTVIAKRNLSKVTVQARFGNEEIKFERKRIRKGQSVEFVYPASDKSARLTVETETGSPHSVEV